MEKLRSLVRPSLTWLGFGTMAFVVIYWVITGQAKDWKDYILAFFTLVGSMISFWFGERNVSKRPPSP